MEDIVKGVRLVFYLNTKLWVFKARKSDVCGRPLFANSFTIVIDYDYDYDHDKATKPVICLTY